MDEPGLAGGGHCLCFLSNPELRHHPAGVGMRGSNESMQVRIHLLVRLLDSNIDSACVVVPDDEDSVTSSLPAHRKD